MKDNEVEVGMKVKVTRLGDTRGMLIHDKHLIIRRIGAVGVVRNWVPGHGGDVWAIVQDDGIACYVYDEIEPV